MAQITTADRICGVEFIIKYELHDKSLLEIGFSRGIGFYIQLNPSAQGAVNLRLMATTMEAIIGAVWLNCNKDVMIILLLIIHLGIMFEF
jgi:ribonuclease-3